MVIGHFTYDSPGMTSLRGDLVFLARLNHELSRTKDSLSTLDQLADSFPTLDEQERNLLSVIYKGAIDPLRQALRTLKSYYETEISEGHVKHAEVLEEQRKRTYAELTEVCQSGISLIVDKLIPVAENVRARAFFYKLIGDMNRYLAECAPGDTITSLLEKAKTSYDKTLEICSESFNIWDPLRLGAILNDAAFEYEHFDHKDKAVELLRSALAGVEESGVDLNAPGFEEAAEACSIILRNLRLWFSSDERDE
jgi:tetratricopeptide (TPR) repeat protein